MANEDIPKKNLFIRYDRIFSVIKDKGYQLSEASSDITRFTKVFNAYQKDKNASLWDRNTFKAIGNEKKTAMRHYNVQELCEFLDVPWYELFSVDAPSETSDSAAALDSESLRIFSDRLLETAAKYEKEIAQLTEQNRKNNETIESITKEIFYKSEQLKQANLKIQNVRKEHLAFKRAVQDMETKINTLDKSNAVKSGAQEALQRQNLEEAEHLLLKARALDIDVLDSRKKEIAKTSSILGDLRFQSFDYENALTFYKDADAQVPNEIEVLKKIGNCYLSLARYQEALEVYKKIQFLVSSHHADDPAEVSEALYLMGMAYNRQGKYAKALENYKSSLIERYGYLDKNDVAIATNLHLIANMQMKLGDFKKSLQNYLKAQSIKDANLEESSPLSTTSKMGIGLSYCYLGDFEESERYLSDSVAFLRDNYSESLELAYAYNNISILYNKTKRFKLSTDVVKKAINISLKYLGEHHDNIGRFYNNLADSLYYGEEFASAIGYYEKSIRIKTGIFGMQHEVIASSLIGMGNCYLKLDDPAKAKDFYERSVAIYSDTLGHSNHKTIEAQSKLHAVQ